MDYSMLPCHSLGVLEELGRKNNQPVVIYTDVEVDGLRTRITEVKKRPP